MEEMAEEEEVDDPNEFDNNPLCVVKKIFCSKKVVEPSQRQQIFQSYYWVSDNKCRLIIYSCSCENLVSKSLIDRLKLSTESHPHPYTVGWIKVGPKIKVEYICRVPLAIGRAYEESVLCDVLEMDAYDVLLGRP